MSNFITSFLFMICFISCAGPTNPFGGEVLFSPEFKLTNYKSSRHKTITINTTPNRQYYNSPFSLELNILDPHFNINNFRYEVLYNNKLLKRWFKSEDIILPKKKGDPFKVIFNDLSILPGNVNKISFLYYSDISEEPLVYHLKVPECYDDQIVEELSISPFKVHSKVENNIKIIAEKYNYNSSLIAALIAQESAFNPKAISIAKALGLTQVTPMAHREIKKRKPQWDIFPGFSELPFLKLKTKINKREISSINDWRMDEEKSIEGGILYLEYLNEYWSTPEKVALLDTVFDKEIPKTDIILASYNSGAYRVKKSLIKNKKDWLFDDNLNEARKYVMRIKSYCHAFNKENQYEN